ncbi:MAG: methyltransferase domain-containing protein [Candidatus Shapirobacteria bacterium]|jgi:SAM-dependent methyltransferase
MKKDDNYVCGMDWTKKVKDYELNNYRKYQYDLIGKYVGREILEVGSGEKGFTNEIVKNARGIKRLVSIEPSKTLFKLHQKRFVFPKYVSFQMEDLFKLKDKTVGHFDTILFIHVLEHIKEDIKAIEKAYELLKPGGMILIEVPALPFLYSSHDKFLGHYRRYSKKYMLGLINRERFNVVDIWYQDFIGVLGSLLYFKFKKITLGSGSGINLVKNQGKFYDSYVVPFQKFVEKYIRPPIGLGLTVVLQKI